VPAVTLASDRPFGRTGASILAQVGLSDLVATTREAYVEMAVAMAADRRRLVDLRNTLRARMSSSPLCDEAAFARDFEAMLFAMVSASRAGGR
jgi:predicted O-linked N-acetylglucosamine transferase (SPINDLY family)